MEEMTHRLRGGLTVLAVFAKVGTLLAVGSVLHVFNHLEQRGRDRRQHQDEAATGASLDHRR
jgi:hypothetical protein